MLVTARGAEVKSIVTCCLIWCLVKQSPCMTCKRSGALHQMSQANDKQPAGFGACVQLHQGPKWVERVETGIYCMSEKIVPLLRHEVHQMQDRWLLCRTNRESETYRESETKNQKLKAANQKLKSANQKPKSRESETKNPANQKLKCANQKQKSANQKLRIRN